MSETHGTSGRPHEAGRYEIRLQGHLDARWSDWFDGLTLTRESDGTTLLEGPVVDQAALHGLLQKVRDTGLPLVSVTPRRPDLHPTLTAPPTQQGDRHDHHPRPPRPTPAPASAPMDPARRSAFFGGLFYLITFASSIPAVFLLRPVLNDSHYIISAGADTQVVWGTILDLVNALTAVGSAVALYPVMKRQSQSMALGFVTTRMFEAAVIAIGVISLLTVVSLRHPGATGAEAHSLVVTGNALVAAYNWVFLVGPNLMPAVNGVLLGTLMYKSGLVPKAIPMMGLVGGPLLLAVTLASMFGITHHGSAWWVVAAPIVFWELLPRPAT